MNHATYIDAQHVKGFIAYLARVISGATPLDFTVGFSRNKLPVGYEQEFSGYVDVRKGGGPVYVVFAQTLEDLFRMYWWDRKDYDENKLALDQVSAAIKAAVDGENCAEHQKLAHDACHEVMKWGFGVDRRPYTANMNWAKGLKKNLASVLRTGRESLSGKHPNIAAFGMDPKSNPKMNAGWTKYYALALPNHIIYDGRVGAALGFLVRRYLGSLPRHEQPASVPSELRFLWADAEGGGKLHDPSSGQYKFSKLYGGPYGSRAWARVNVQANWILSEAMNAAKADWCSGLDGLRKLEAALFMLGYDLSRADERNPMAEAA
ncbi:hypothetical protein [Cupriavidus taiwanensis]|uniref:hypothetical protein n=1 Tax=Cupriavidus taiwanensis TaxID=164546 RepID=UPI000E10E5F5|nr:hypothetical protein [Cupriavidus taiwanensis]SPA56687.1 conserved protein of unknown function [Cupriavidus taiwanensis]